MSFFSTLLDTARRPFSSSDETPAGRRQFFRRAAGASAAAVAAGLALPDDAWAGVLERAEANGIRPGTLVGPDGRPLDRRAMPNEPCLGEVRIFGFNFAPRGWAMCQGQLLPIAQYSAVYSLLGTTFGGDGRTTFGLPDLQGRSPRGMGTGPGLGPVTWGQKGGQENSTLTVANLAAHTHNPRTTGAPATTTIPASNAMGVATANVYGAPGGSATMAETTSTGSNQQFSNLPPYLGLNYCVALQGIFPSRN